MKPSRAGYVNAVQIYPFSEGALYQIYTAPAQITDIALEAGEQLVGSGPVAAGDTVRWIIGDTESGAGASRRVHIMVKPTRSNLRTNLIINTDRRTYHIELRSAERTYMASVSWSYPQSELFAALPGAGESGTPPGMEQVLPSLEKLNFRYKIAGDDPPWRPIRAVDDGHQVYIEFPTGIAQGEMPPSGSSAPMAEPNSSTTASAAAIWWSIGCSRAPNCDSAASARSVSGSSAPMGRSHEH